MEVKDWLYIIGLVVTLVLGIANAIPGIRKTRRENEKTDAERQAVEDRITEAVLKRAEAQLAAYKKDNDELRTENDALRRNNADVMKMVRAIRMLTVKLIDKMEKAKIDPELTPEEREALYNTDKLSKYARKSG